MRTIAIINQKGGCGKTTVAINLAAVMAARGHKTLLVDVDPQSHCALGLAVPESQVDTSVGDLLRAGLDGSIAFSDVTWQISRNLDLVPSTMALAGLEAELAGMPDKDRRLQQVLATVSDHYDFCIVDCPPAIGLLTFNALRAAQEVLIPVETGYFALQGSVKQEATIQMLARRAHHRCRFKVLATMYDVRTKLAREILSELKRHFDDKLLPIVVHFNSKLKEAASFGQAITEYDPASRGMDDFDKLAEWLLDNVPEWPQEVEQPKEAESPTMSRAAELVERARALSRRSAALSAQLADDEDVTRETATSSVATADVTSQASTVEQKAGPAHSTLVPESHAATRRKPTLDEKLEKIYGVRPTSQGLLFVQPANGRDHDIRVAGDFNDWSPEKAVMQRDERLGVWQATVPVEPGRYRYRLVIDGNWTRDPYNDYVEANPFGELNSVVEVGETNRT